MPFFCFGADEQIRTAYLLITNEVLYRLSYISARNEHYSEASRSLQVLISENAILFFDADDTLQRVDAGKRLDAFERLAHAELARRMREERDP